VAAFADGLLNGHILGWANSFVFRRSVFGRPERAGPLGLGFAAVAAIATGNIHDDDPDEVSDDFR